MGNVKKCMENKDFLYIRVVGLGKIPSSSPCVSAMRAEGGGGSQLPGLGGSALLLMYDVKCRLLDINLRI